MEGIKSEDNLCGQTLLRLSASGSSILAELSRLAQNIPDVFRAENQYTSILFDFVYLKNSEEAERLLNETTGMLDLDQEFIDSFGPIVMRFYGLFESIVTYLEEYLEFIQNLNSGIFIQYTTESVLQDTHGKQLMCECLYLYGVMLLMLERHIPGTVRERMVIAVMRHQPEASLEKLEDVCKLIRSTGYLGHGTPVEKNPKDYPEKFFARFPVDKRLVKMIIQTLQSDDIYKVAESFPAPEHRSTRLASQAGMMYVILYFCPELLKTGDAAMREAVDKHFSDSSTSCWIISVHMGYTVDLSAQWKGYEAAKKALNNILTTDNVTRAAEQNLAWLTEAKAELKGYLTEGVLTEQYVLLNLQRLVECMRKANVALRWRLLHRKCSQPKFKAFIHAQVDDKGVIDLLLQSAQLEFKVKAIVGELLDKKQAQWCECRALCAGRLKELSEYFTGSKALTRVKKDERMQSWFASVAAEVEAMSDGSEESSSSEGGGAAVAVVGGQHSTVLGRKIQKTIAALEEVEQFDQIDTDVQIKQFLEDTRELLRQMIRVVNVGRQDLTRMEVITDLSYAFELLNDYTPIIHQRVRAEPSYSVLLRAGFVKLSSILDVPLTRINEVGSSGDVESVAQFYSTELVDFMRRVLDIIPRSVFEILQRIIKVQTSRLKPLPVKFESQYLKEYAQVDERYLLAEMTHRASTFTEGVLEMEKTVLGIIQVDARQILHDGLRKELVRQVSAAMHATLVFTNDKTQTASTTQADVRVDFEKAMKQLQKLMEGFRRSIEYIQDYVDMAGLKMWQEELARIVNYNIEQECNRYLKKKVLDHNSKYQSKVIPIPRFPVPPAASGAINTQAVNFMGRAMNCLLACTDPSQTTYGPEAIAWFTSDGTEVCGIKAFSVLHSGLNVTGLAGLDKLLGFRIVHELGFFLRFYKDTVKPFLPALEQMRDGLFPDSGLPPNATKLYGLGLKKLEKLMGPLLKVVLKMGQGQLLRRQLGHVLQFGCRLDANLLYQALTTLDEAVLLDVREHYRSPAEKPYPASDNPLLGSLSKLLEASGLSDPLNKIYVVTEPVESLPVLLMFFVITYMSKVQWDPEFATLVRRKATFALDGMPLVVGVWTLLKQFHPSYTRQLLAYLGQFVRSTVHGVLHKADLSSLAHSGGGGKKGSSEPMGSLMPLEVTNTLLFINMLAKVGKLPRSVVAEFIPSYLFDSIGV